MFTLRPCYTAERKGGRKEEEEGEEEIYLFFPPDEDFVQRYVDRL